VPFDAPTPLFTGERLRDLVLCYAGPWAFVPYLKNRDDEEVLLAFSELVVGLALVFGGLFPILGDLSLRWLLPIWLLWCLAMSVTSILQGAKGKRHKIPVLHQFVEFL
jgi:hypothetical protein